MIPLLRAVPVGSPEEIECGPIAPFYFAQWQRADFLAALNEQLIAALDWGKEGAPSFDGKTSLDAIIIAWGLRTGGSVVLLFDHFEEYLSTTPPDSEQPARRSRPAHSAVQPDASPLPTTRETDHFDRVLARLVNRRDVPANVLLSLREDEAFRLDRFRMRIPHLMANSMRINPLTDRQAGEALRTSLAAFNREAERLNRAALVVHIPEDDDPISEVVHEARSAGGSRSSDHRIEPAFLQIAMQELWNHEAEVWKENPDVRRELRRSVLVGRLGGVKAILEKYLEKLLGNTLSRRELPIASRTFGQLISPHGEKIPMFVSQLATRIEPWLSWKRLRRYIVPGRNESEGKEQLDQRSATVLAKLERVNILRKIPPDRYDIYHQVLAAPLMRWHQDFDSWRIRRNWVIAGLVAALVVAGITRSLSEGVAAKEAERRIKRFNDVFATMIPIRDPGLALTLAAYAYRSNPTATTRAGVASALESSEGWLIGHTGQVSGVDFSLDGKILASAGADGQVIFWKTETYRRIGGIRQSKAVNAAVFRPRSTELVTVSDDHTVRVWDVPRTTPQGREKDSLDDVVLLYEFSESKDAHAHTGEVWTAAFSGDGRYLVTGGQDKKAKIWDMAGRSWVRDFDIDYELVTSTFSPDGSKVAVGGLGDKVDILDIHTGGTTRLQGHTDFVYGLVYSDDGGRLASSSWDGSVILWDIRAGKAERTFVAGVRLWGLAMNHAGSTITASSRDGSLVFWDSQSAQAVSEFSGRAEVLTALSRTPQFDLIAAGSLRGPIRLFRVTPRVVVDGRISAIAFSSGANRLIAAASARADVTVTPGGATSSQAPSPGAMWDLSGTQLNAKLKPLPAADTIDSVASDAAGATFITGSRNGRVDVWNWGAERPLSIVANGVTVQAVAISKDGRRLAAGDWNGDIRVWQQQAGGYTVVSEFHLEPAGRVSALAFSPDGARLAIGWDNASTAVQVRDLASGSPMRLNVADGLKVQTLAFSPSGDKLAAGFEDGSLVAWRPSGDSRPKDPYKFLIGHNSSIITVDFDATGLRLASGSRDKTARVWALESEEPEVTIPAQEAVTGVKFLDDGRLVVIDVAGNTKIQDLDWGRLARIASARGRPLEDAECQRYFAGRCPEDLGYSAHNRVDVQR